MKRILISLIIFLFGGMISFAQKYALVDMEYILKNIPNYEMMNEQLETISKKWQQEVQKLQTEAETLYKKYQSDLVFLSAKQKKEAEELIVKKEREATELQTKYFGPEGELYKKRTEMMKPIQDEIWEAIKEIAKANSFQLVLDRGTSGIIYANPGIDISDQVLKKMGYSKK
ncbi:OmpH family outer membrane protein [Porphyromonas circumdentaria]|uniref:Periplasmic chaperone for outer membrane proteins Skp n=1 Tax=Porphyromonas circumdentaria TaxID=29524 RepID=A0A1T4L060_9PORP|nr:OmpH family outer membrane protein [Porphyromonas circumdentaria]MBB6275156.1 outer membrane protein [Porphyromonas circumdentaria]MDO4721787.1 OmpH family outer membrane protein [Porphyromonas circumdentaria]SJZ47927.1 periplasmic chaperone for outer membrane proteins Skp [Porphyromonas circumdentaria]